MRVRGVRSGMADSLARDLGPLAVSVRVLPRTGSGPGAEGRRGRVRGREGSATSVPGLSVDAVLGRAELRSLRREIAVLLPQLLLLTEEGIVLDLALSRLPGLEAVLATVAAVLGAELVLVASPVLRNRRICPGRTELRTVLGLRGLSIGAEPVLIGAQPILLRAAPVRGAAGPVLRDGRLHARAVLLGGPAVVAEVRAVLRDTRMLRAGSGLVGSDRLLAGPEALLMSAGGTVGSAPCGLVVT